MTATVLSTAELHDRLIAAGQPLEDTVSADAPAVVWPTPETIISVALNLDPTLMPAYRDSYFACLVNSERTPAIRDDPAFALDERFRRIDEGRTFVSGFLDGPFRWLLPRLIGFQEILLWPEKRAGDFAWRVEAGELPGVRHLLPSDPSMAGAVVIDLGRDEGCRALWEVAIAVTDGFDNVFVSDPACAEVVLLHHHDRIVLSIPDEARRRAALAELRGCRFIEDCSGYSASRDDEDDG